VKLSIQMIVLTVLLLTFGRFVQYYYFYSTDQILELDELHLESYMHGSRENRLELDGSLKIKSVNVIKETHDTLTFELVYDYSGTRAESRIWFSANILNLGKSYSMTGFKPGRILKGEGNKTRVYLTLIDRSDEELDSDVIIFKAYPSRGSSFHSQAFSYQKHWCKERAKVWQLLSACN